MLLNCDVREDSRVPWTVRRSNQSILKEISPRCSLEGLMLKLKLQYFSHLMRRANSLENTLMLGKIEGRRRRGRQRIRWLDGITDLTDMDLGGLGSWWWTGRPGMLRFMGLQRVAHDWVAEMNWTELNYKVSDFSENNTSDLGLTKLLIKSSIFYFFQIYFISLYLRCYFLPLIRNSSSHNYLYIYSLLEEI